MRKWKYGSRLGNQDRKCRLAGVTPRFLDCACGEARFSPMAVRGVSVPRLIHGNLVWRYCSGEAALDGGTVPTTEVPMVALPTILPYFHFWRIGL